jgi:Na+/H+ antiporter NhaD/arsenite permease-like protein
MPEIDGATLSLVWIIPFAGLLLSIAVAPALGAHFWHRHFPTVSLLWALAFVLPFAAAHGLAPAAGAVLHALLIDYLPFIILLTTLYIVAGGVRLTGTIRGTPAVNTLLMALGSGAASIMGTTGAAMLFLRPLIRANRRRRHNVHVFVFFIFLVGNIGGSLSPLGDPPLLIGFLEGVPFFWPAVHLFPPMLLSISVLLSLFYVLDRNFHRQGWHDETDAIQEVERLGIEGKLNILLLALVPGIVFLMGESRQDAPVIEWHYLHIEVATLVGSLAMLVVAGLSLWLTRPAIRRANEFSWRPISEVGAVFAAIFITMIPALAILHAGPHGALASLVTLVAPHGKPIDAMYFWLTGVLSSLLDNAPTYLVFFNLAGGDPVLLTGPLSRTLLAISAGAVLMGANTYIGNAPNFMVKAVCEERGIAMPSFLGYIGWAAMVLLPLYGLLTLVFFR